MLELGIKAGRFTPIAKPDMSSSALLPGVGNSLFKLLNGVCHINMKYRPMKETSLKKGVWSAGQ